MCDEDTTLTLERREDSGVSGGSRYSSLEKLRRVNTYLRIFWSPVGPTSSSFVHDIFLLFLGGWVMGLLGEARLLIALEVGSTSLSPSLP